MDVSCKYGWFYLILVSAGGYQLEYQPELGQHFNKILLIKPTFR
jgi:hypothetical protein